MVMIDKHLDLYQWSLSFLSNIFDKSLKHGYMMVKNDIKFITCKINLKMKDDTSGIDKYYFYNEDFSISFSVWG